MRNIICLLISVSCLITTSYAVEKNSLNDQLQLTIEKYLANQGKAEGVTGIAASVLYPQDKTSHQPVVKTYVTGKVGYPPYNKPVTLDNLFEIGSITKSFAAMLILQLQAEGKLSLDDKIGRWLPQYPNWKDVTIRQLLNMTSGIPSYSFNPEFLKIIYGNIRAELTEKEILSYANPNKPLSHQGTKFEYSNTNYILAGMIVEAVTQHSFADELQTRLLNSPCALKNTYYVAGAKWKTIRNTIMPRMVHGYYYDDAKKKMIDVTDSNLTWAGPAGAMVADTQDMITWVQVLYHGLAVDEKARKQTLADLESVVSMKTGQSIATVTKDNPRGFGLGVGYLYEAKEGRFWVYKGSGMGYRMMYLWRPCNNVTIVAALNNKGGGKRHGGDHIENLIINMYKQIMNAYPEYNCKD